MRLHAGIANPWKFILAISLWSSFEAKKVFFYEMSD
jgi:hypothetical protein